MKILLSILLFALAAGMACGAGEMRIQQQFIEYFAQRAPGTAGVKKLQHSLRADGTWTDIDYTSRRRGEWPTRKHLDRLRTMATAYADPASELYRQDGLKAAVLRGLEHWIKKDYQNPNWYNARIGVPDRLGCALVLMGDAVPDAMLEEARPILYRSELGMTGQNKVWCAGIGIMKGVLYADQALLERAVQDIWSELQVSTGEGIQPDWSFHQHGPQQQFGNYGKSFGDDMIQWASILRGTAYALSGDKLDILRNYLLEGPSWVLWNGRMDLSGCGRQVDQGCQQSKARSILRQLDGMKAIDPEYAAAYDATHERVGFNAFWRSEMAVQRRPDWYASVKMSSKRVIGSESCNSENMLGLHLGDGVLLTYVEGDEYEDIMPLWDWKRLPGTTCDQGLDDLTPSTLEGYGGSDFSGVLGSDETGMAAMIYKRGNLSARKSWFFFKDHIVCLGAGISGETKGPVFTSVEQAWLKEGVSQDKNVIQHNNVAYQVLDGKFQFSDNEVEGNWLSSFPTRPDRPVSGKVFSLWIDHGPSPKDATYAYTIFPTIGNRDAGVGSTVLENSTAVQAVAWKGERYAVFYEPGVLKVAGGEHIEVSAPCLLVISDDGMLVADPLQARQRLDVKVNAKTYSVELPQGAERGRQVEVKF